MNVYPPRRWAHMRRAWAARSLDRLEACSITQTLAPARSTKSEPRDALSDACNMTSRKEAALGRRRGRSCRRRALPAGVPVVEQLPAGVERHGMMEEHRQLVGAWLDALDHQTGIARLNGHERSRQLRGEERAEGLVRDPTDAPVPQPTAASLIEWETDLAAVVADRYERVDVDDVTGAALGGDVDRRRPGDGTIDDVALTDADGLEQDRDGARRRDRATNMDLRELSGTEDEALRGIDVHSGHIERARERGEVMRVSERREPSAERALEGLGRVEAGGVMGLEVRQHRRERRPAPSADGAADRAEERPGELCEELDHVSGGGAEDVLGPEVEGRIKVVGQGPEHLRGLGSVVDEGGCHRAGARPGEEVEMLVERSRPERFLEGREDTDLVEDADDAAAGENEGPPLAVRGRQGGMLTGDHGWSPRLATEPCPESRSLSDIERRGSDSGESVSVPSESRAAAATAKAMTATSTAVMSDIVHLP